MSRSNENVTIHTKKFYRIVLEGFDPSIDTAASFAVKLSMRTRLSLPRTRQIVAGLPRVVKSNISSSQANRLKCVLEAIGGKVRLESHLVTPGESGDIAADLQSGGGGTQETVVCPSCGWEEKGGAAFCSICLGKFRVAGSPAGSPAFKLPETNPLEAGEGPSTGQIEFLKAFVVKNQLSILIGAFVILLIVVFSK